MSDGYNLPAPPVGGAEDYNPFNDPASPFYRESGDFRPTRRSPVPARKCSAKKRDGSGEQCGRWAIAGGTVCTVHGGQLPRVKERAEAVLDAARLMLLDSVPDALGVVYGLAMNAETPDAVRLNAAKDIMDRAGLKNAEQVDLNVAITEKPSAKLFERLENMRTDKKELEDLGEVDEPTEEAKD